MASIFTRIINGEIPCYKVAEDDNYFAFLDISPLKRGHTLVIPKRETDYIFDMEDDDLAGLMVFAGKVAHGLKKVVPCKRIGLTVIGLEVPHAHIHLIPIDREADTLFSNPRLTIPPAEMAELAASVAAAIKL